jgi:hypothetical protein
VVFPASLRYDVAHEDRLRTADRDAPPLPSETGRTPVKSNFAAPKTLSRKLSKQLLAYATMAGAGLMGCASNADAEVVYTPAHKYVDQDFFIDLNHDGINDFHIHSYYLSGFAYLQVLPLVKFNKIAAVHHGCLSGYGAAPLREGVVIGSGMAFSANGTCMVEKALTSASMGPWLGVTDRYLGFEFFIEGQKHFGWARMTIDLFGFDHTGRILGYAYETTPGTPIVAGDQGNATQVSLDPGTLGALALGAAKF